MRLIRRKRAVKGVVVESLYKILLILWILITYLVNHDSYGSTFQLASPLLRFRAKL